MIKGTKSPKISANYLKGALSRQKHLPSARRKEVNMGTELLIAVYIIGYLMGWVAAFRLMREGLNKNGTDISG